MDAQRTQTHSEQGYQNTPLVSTLLYERVSEKKTLSLKEHENTI